MATIVDLDTGQVLGVVDGRDDKDVGDCAVRPASGMAPGCAGRGNRHLHGVPEGVANVAAPHRGRG
jgi:hypothetical protein